VERLNLNFIGLGLALFTLISIGFGFWWVVKLEYIFGARIWKIVLGLGILICLVSAFMPDFKTAALIGILGGSLVWGATELPAQEDRVKRGHFPANPKRFEKEG